MANHPSKRGSGRPSLCHEPATSAIIQAVRAGCIAKAAAPAGNVSVRTLHGWLAQGRKDTEGGRTKTAFSQFLQAYKKAEGEFIGDCLRGIVRAGSTQWTALAWILERRWPEDFANNRAEIREVKRRLDEVLKLLSERK